MSNQEQYLSQRFQTSGIGPLNGLWQSDSTVTQPINAPSHAGSLRRALEDSADLRALLAEHSAYGLAVPDSLTAEFEAAQAQVKAAAAEDRRWRLLAAQAEVERLRSQEEKLAEAKLRLERIENEVRVAEGK